MFRDLIKRKVPTTSMTTTHNLIAVWTFWQSASTYTAAVSDQAGNGVNGFFPGAVGPTLQSAVGDTPNPHPVPRVFPTPQRGTNRLGRDSLEVHQGGANDSAGRITIDPAEYDRFRRFYRDG